MLVHAVVLEPGGCRGLLVEMSVRMRLLRVAATPPRLLREGGAADKADLANILPA